MTLFDEILAAQSKDVDVKTNNFKDLAALETSKSGAYTTLVNALNLAMSPIGGASSKITGTPTTGPLTDEAAAGVANRAIAFSPDTLTYDASNPVLLEDTSLSSAMHLADQKSIADKYKLYREQLRAQREGRNAGISTTDGMTTDAGTETIRDGFVEKRDEMAGQSTEPAINTSGQAITASGPAVNLNLNAIDTANMDTTAKQTILAKTAKNTIGQVVQGGAQQWAGSNLSAIATPHTETAVGGPKARRELLKLSHKGGRRMTPETKAYNREQLAAYELEREQLAAAQRQGARDAIVTADDMIELGSLNIEKAKEGKGSLGTLGIDVAVGLEQLGLDIGATAITGGKNILPALGLRSFGGGASEARSDGASHKQQIQYGALSAAVEVATEKLFSVGRALRGLHGDGAIPTSTMEELISKMATRYAKSQAGKSLAETLVKTGLAATTEGAEEAIASIANPFIKNMVYSENETIDWSGVGRDALIGGIIGGIVGGGGEVANFAQGKKMADKMDAEAVDAMVQSGLASAEGTKSNELARTMSEKLTAGTAVTYGEYLNLQRENFKEIAKEHETENRRLFNTLGIPVESTPSGADKARLNVALRKKVSEASKVLEDRGNALSESDIEYLKDASNVFRMAANSEHVTTLKKNKDVSDNERYARVAQTIDTTLAKFIKSDGYSEEALRVNELAESERKNAVEQNPVASKALRVVGDIDYDVINVNHTTGIVEFIKTDGYDRRDSPRIISITTVDGSGNVTHETPTTDIAVDKSKYNTFGMNLQEESESTAETDMDLDTIISQIEETNANEDASDQKNVANGIVTGDNEVNEVIEGGEEDGIYQRDANSSEGEAYTSRNDQRRTRSSYEEISRRSRSVASDDVERRIGGIQAEGDSGVGSTSRQNYATFMGGPLGKALGISDVRFYDYEEGNPYGFLLDNVPHIANQNQVPQAFVYFHEVGHYIARNLSDEFPLRDIITETSKNTDAMVAVREYFSSADISDAEKHAYQESPRAMCEELICHVFADYMSEKVLSEDVLPTYQVALPNEIILNVRLAAEAFFANKGIDLNSFSLQETQETPSIPKGLQTRLREVFTGAVYPNEIDAIVAGGIENWNKEGTLDALYNDLMAAASSATFKPTPLSERELALRKTLRSTKLKVTDYVKSDFSDYEVFRRRNIAFIKLTKDGQAIDSFYEELVDTYPEYFSGQIVNTADQLCEIVDVSKLLSNRDAGRVSDAMSKQEISDHIIEPILELILNTVNGIPLTEKTGGNNGTEAERLERRTTRDKEKVHGSSRGEGKESKTAVRRGQGGDKADADTNRQAGGPKSQAAGEVRKLLDSKDKFTSKQLFKITDEAFGGTQAEGTYDVRTAFDVMELAVNQYLIDHADEFKAEAETETLGKLEELVSLLPTQGSHRSEKMEMYQQFSTPPTIAFLAGYVANISENDVILEPSAGIGGLVALPKGWGATVHVNELEDGRLDTIKNLPFDSFSNHNAEQINNLLDDSIKPTRIIMNPPFSTAAERTGNKRDTTNAKRHIEQALLTLEDDGRLVAIVGNGMSDTAPRFEDWWNELRNKYDIKANIRIDGQNYKKYGTTFDVNMVVIDKTGKSENNTITGEFKTLESAMKELEGIRNDAKRIELQRNRQAKPNTTVATSDESTGESERRGTVSTTSSRGSAVHTDTGTQSGIQRSDRGRTESDIDETTDGTGNVRDVDDAVGRRGRDGDNGSNYNGSSREGRNEGGQTVLSSTRSDDRVRDVSTVNDTEGVLRVEEKPKNKAIESEDDVYNAYKTAKLTVKDAKRHPTDLVESAAMSAVDAPVITYVPKLNSTLVKDGTLSDAQLEAISSAGQAHENILPNGFRQGFFIGDGTGVGKGREISGIIADNMNRGRKKAVWVSENVKLMKDAQRDWIALGNKSDDVFSLQKTRAGGTVSNPNGILFVSYDTLGRKPTGNITKTRVQQIVEWFGADYDGVIVFDEAHNMSSAQDSGKGRNHKKASDKAIAGVDLQEALPNARIVYASATGATDVSHLAYAQRLGLWGKGTSFNDVNDFISKVESGGLAAMELVARDMKSLGVYTSRNLSYKGVGYDTIMHNLTPMQTAIYDELSNAWQVVLENLETVLVQTNAASDGNARGRATSQFYGSMQRFYNQILTSLAMPAVIENIKEELGNGNSVVVQLTNTNEAGSKRELVRIEQEGGSLDDVDMTPSGTLISYLESGFPIFEFEEYEDDKGNKKARVVKDSEGKNVISKEAVRVRGELIDFVKQLKVPDGPLEILFDEFGSENVAEITGRSQRIVTKDGKRVLEKRGSQSGLADEKAFQDGKKRILVFSDAGGTGRSYHADKNAKNQQKRIHILLQPGWNASKATQGFGRTHRSNQAVAPTFRLVTTDISGQKRFTSTIAKRLDQLGALTKGQRDAGSGVFNSNDNLENSTARDALQSWYKKAAQNAYGFDGADVFQKMGLANKLLGEYGEYIENLDVVRDTPKFLNRILALNVELQNEVFASFEDEMNSLYQTQLEMGLVDVGTENYITEKIEIQSESVIREDKGGAQTKYMQLIGKKKPTILDFEDVATYRPKFEGLYKIDDEVRAVYRISNKTLNNGEIVEQYKLLSPVLNNNASTFIKSTLDRSAVAIPKAQWRKEWNEQVSKSPEYVEETLHLLTGVLLPVWDKLPQDKTRVMRVMDEAGTQQYLGRLISADKIDAVLRGFGLDRKREVFTAEQIYDKVLGDNNIAYLRDAKQKIERRRVSGENRLEVTGDNTFYLKQVSKDIIVERIGPEFRYFIPTDKAKAKSVIDAIVATNPVVEIKKSNKDSISDEEQYAFNLNDGNEERSLVGSYYKPANKDVYHEVYTDEAAADIRPISDIINDMSKRFGFKFSTKRFNKRKAIGAYNTKYGFIISKYSNAIGVVAHELGHRFDANYNLSNKYKMEVKAMAQKLPAEVKEKYSEADLAGEAIADFMTLYLTNPQGAMEFGDLGKHRNFYDIFEDLISTEDFENLKKTRGEVINWLGADIVEKAKTTIRSYGEKEKFTLDERKKQLYASWVNGFEGFEEVNRAIEKRAHKKVLPSENVAYKAYQSQYADVFGYRIAHEGMVDPEGNRIGKSFASIYKGKISKKELSDFDAYLKLVHSLDWMDQGKATFGPDFTREGILSAIEKLDKANPQFKDTAQELYDWWDTFMRVWLVDTGFVDADAYEYMHQIYPHYVPNFRAEDFQSQFSSSTGEISPIKRASKHGSDKDTYSATQSMIMEMDRYIKAVQRRDVLLTMHKNYNDIDYAYVMGDFMRKVSPEMDRGIYNAKSLKETLHESLFGNYVKNMSEAEKRGFDELPLAKQMEQYSLTGDGAVIEDVINDYIEFYTPKKFSTDSDIVTVVDESGKTFFYEVTDRYLAQAITNLHAASPQSTNDFIRILASIKRTMTVLTTSGNPIFGITSNIWRDIPHAYVMGKYQNPFTFSRDLAKAFYQAVTKGELYQQYRAIGGGFESPIGADAQYLKKTLRKMGTSDTKREKFVNSVATIIDVIEGINNTLETAPRLVEFSKWMEESGDTYDGRLEAVFRARDVTVNFKRRGGGNAAQTMAAIIPFFNAGVQGLDKFYRGVYKDNEIRRSVIIKSLYSISLLSIAEALLYADDDDYARLPDYYKNNYWLIKILDGEGKFIRIPKPRELGVLFGTTFTRAIREIMHPEEDNGIALLHAFKDNFTIPLSWVGAPVVQTMSNKSWSGGKIVSQRYDALMVKGTYDEVYDDTTSEIAVATSVVLDAIPGLDLGAAMTPKGIQYLLQQYTGGLGQIILPATAVGVIGKTNTPSEKALEMAESTIAGLKKKMTADVVYSNRYVDDFYDVLSKLEAEKAKKKKDGEVMDAAADEWRLKFGRNSRGTKSSPGMSDYWAEIHQITNNRDLSPKEKQEQIKEVRKKMNKMAEDIVREYEAYERKKKEK